jgi:hypothetical protein
MRKEEDPEVSHELDASENEVSFLRAGEVRKREARVAGTQHLTPAHGTSQGNSE